MALKIRLRQQGRKNYVTYRLVVMDERKNRDGKYVEMLGWFDPNAKADDKKALLDEDRIHFWVNRGAILSERAKILISKKAPLVIKELNERNRRKSIKRAASRRKGKKG